MALPSEVAVYCERPSDFQDYKPMKPGLNVRVFNVTETGAGNYITRDDAGMITLKEGFYRITASSLVANYDPNSKDVSTLLVATRPPAGYAFLFVPDGQDPPKEMLAIGTVNHANTCPSLIDTYVTVAPGQRLAFGVGQQLGDYVAGIYLRVPTPSSVNHVFARIVIERY